MNTKSILGARHRLEPGASPDRAGRADRAEVGQDFARVPSAEPGLCDRGSPRRATRLPDEPETHDQQSVCLPGRDQAGHR